MAMQRVLGSELQVGVTESGLGDRVLEQSSTRSKLGEIREYKDKDGETKAVYKTHDATSKREEVSFEAILKANVEKNVGDPITYDGKNAVVTKWDVIESNDDVKKVSITIRTYPDL